MMVVTPDRSYAYIRFEIGRYFKVLIPECNGEACISYGARVDCDRVSGYGVAWVKPVKFSTKTLTIILRDSCNQWTNCRGPCHLWRWKLYDHKCLFFINNFRYFFSKGREEVSIDDSIYVVFEFKSWWWSDAINPSIFHVILVHLTILFATELISIVIGI